MGVPAGLLLFGVWVGMVLVFMRVRMLFGFTLVRVRVIVVLVGMRVILLLMRMGMLMVFIRMRRADFDRPQAVLILRRGRVDTDRHGRRAGARRRHVDAEDAGAGGAADWERLRCAAAIGQLDDDAAFGEGPKVVQVRQVDGEPRRRADLERLVFSKKLRLVGPMRHSDGLGLFSFGMRVGLLHRGGTTAEKNQDKEGQLLRVHGNTSAPIARSNSISASFAAAFSSSSRSCDCCATRKESINSRIPSSPS